MLIVYPRHPAFWGCPDVFQQCQMPNSDYPEDHPADRQQERKGILY